MNPLTKIYIGSERIYLGFDSVAGLQDKIKEAVQRLVSRHREIDVSTEFVLTGDMDGEDSPCLKVSAFNSETEETKLRNEYFRLDRQYANIQTAIQFERENLSRSEIRAINAKTELDDFLALHPEFKT